MKTDTPFKLDQCIIKPREFSIELSNGEKKILQPKFVEVLTYLAAQYPRLVDRQELIDVIWDGNHFVGEKSLTNAIWNLRNELKETNNTYIETVRKKGYRLVVEPEYLQEETALINDEENSETKSLLNKSVNWGILFIVLIIGVISNWNVFNGSSSDYQEANIESITNAPGREVYPVVSPDNRHLIFSWRRIGHQPNLFIRDFTNVTQAPRQLTYSDDYEGPAVWHPNGEVIYFPRKQWDYSRCDIVELNIVTEEQKVIGKCTGELDFSLAISPDGKQLAFIEVNEQTHSQKVKFISTKDSGQSITAYTCEIDCNYNDLDTVYSPDGKYLAVSRTYDEGLNEDIFLFDIEKQSFKQLTNTEGDIKGMIWHPNGDRIIFSSRVSGKRNGYVINIKNKRVDNLNIPGFSYPRFIPNSKSLVYHSWLVNSQLSSISVDEPLATAPFPVIQSDFSYHSPHYSQVTNRMVFISNESGFEEVWTAKIDGTDAQKLTSLDSHLTFPRWSNNGEYIAFLGPKNDAGGNALYVLNVKSSVVKTVKSNFEQHFRPSWSTRGDKLIAAARHQGKRALYAFPIDGSAPELLLDEKVKYAEQASDGSIWYSLGRNSGLWRFKPQEKEVPPVNVLSAEEFRMSYNWEITNEGVYFQHDYADHHQINFYNLSTSKIEHLVKLPIGTIQRMASMAVITEQDKIVFTQLEFPKVDIKKLSHPLLD